MGNLQVLEIERGMKELGSILYLFCVGFEVLGGILLKLEPTCLYGFFFFASKSSRPCDEDAEAAFFDAEAEAEVNGRACAVAISGHVESTMERARARAARTLDQVFIFICSVSVKKIDKLEPYD